MFAFYPGRKIKSDEPFRVFPASVDVMLLANVLLGCFQVSRTWIFARYNMCATSTPKRNTRSGLVFYSRKIWNRVPIEESHEYFPPRFSLCPPNAHAGLLRSPRLRY